MFEEFIINHFRLAEMNATEKKKHAQCILQECHHDSSRSKGLVSANETLTSTAWIPTEEQRKRIFLLVN